MVKAWRFNIVYISMVKGNGYTTHTHTHTHTSVKQGIMLTSIFEKHRICSNPTKSLSIVN